MNEIYWITVLGNLSNITGLIAIFSGIIGASFLISLFVCDISYDKERKQVYKISKISLAICAVSSLLSIFTPSTKEAMAIYGVGTVVDYVQENKDVKDIPDKAVQCINKFLEDYSEDNKSK